MDQLKDDPIAGTGDEKPKIKEEVDNEYDFPEENPTSCKDASEEKRTFLVTLNSKDGRKHEVRGRLTDSLLSALKSNTSICDWMERKEGEEFHLIEKEEKSNIFVNMGMPLKYVPNGSQFELKFHPATNEIWYRQYDDVKEECIVFCVHKKVSIMKTRRAQQRRLVKSLQLHKEHCVFRICAPKGESIKDAVCKDGRFMQFLKEENWTLDDGSISKNIDFPVESLSDQVIYEIGVESKKKTARHSDDLNKKQNDSDLGERQLSNLAKPKPRPDLEEGQPSTSKRQQRELDCEQGQPSTSKRQKPESDCEQGQLSTSKRQQQEDSELRVLHLYPKLKEEKENIAKFLRGKNNLEVYKRNFGKEMNDSLSCKLVRILAKNMDSVGYIGRQTPKGFEGVGTCFVLRGRCILTCHHVIRDIVGEGIEPKDWGNRIKQLARVTFCYETFSYEELHRMEPWFSLENWFEVTDVDLDFAVLKLEENGSNSHPPPGLLHLLSPPQLNGPIFIIGHPKGEVKSMDVCLVVSIPERDKAIGDHLQKHKDICVCSYRPEKCIHRYNPENFKRYRNDPNIVTYDTCFFGGSSGSPVFNQNGELVALHAAGFLYEKNHKECSIIELGYLIDSIILKIKSTFKPWYDAIIAPDEDAFVSEAGEEMDCN